MAPTPPCYDHVIDLRATRNFLPDAVTPEHLAAILEAARWTGSSKNTQQWEFIVVDTPEGLEALASAGTFTRPVLNSALTVALVWPPDGYEFDIGRAAQNLMLAADALGVASCPITLHDEDRAREVLGVPAGHRCRYAVALGYPDPEAEAAERRERRAAGKTGRKPLDEVVSKGRYSG
ncbi:MAG: nitroreductase family protein [Actinobacteria bacterium]|nr:nitroreductase family protein [Actinomycetota bacterium]